MTTRTIQAYMSQLTPEDAAIYARVVERANGYLPMIAADTRDAEIMKITVHNPTLAPALTELAVALQSDEATAIDFGAFPMPCFEAAYFAERSEHIVLAGDGVTSWNHHERIVSLATGAPSMDYTVNAVR